MTKKSTIALFASLVFILPVTAWALLNLYEKRVEGLPVLGKSPDHTIADFNLINQLDSPKSTADWEGKIVIADFFFTHCPVICPRMTNNLKRVAAAFENDGAVLINSFTVDPTRDDPAQLRAFAQRFQLPAANWDLLTGEKKEVYRLARNSFMVVATDGDGGPDDFIHSERLVLVDKKKRIRGYYDGTSQQETDQLIIDIKKLKHEQ